MQSKSSPGKKSDTKKRKVHKMMVKKPKKKGKENEGIRKQSKARIKDTHAYANANAHK